MQPSSTTAKSLYLSVSAANGGRSGYYQIGSDRGRIAAERPYLANLACDGRNRTASHSDRHSYGWQSFDNLINDGNSFEGSQIITRGGYGYHTTIPA